jgi:seryl-tRNA synthetase
MSPTEKAIATVRTLDARITELERQLSDADMAARAAESEAAALAGEPGFDAAVDRITKSGSRITALRAALKKLESERKSALLNIASTRKAELEVEATRIDNEVRKIHSEARILLDRLAALMGVEVYPISILFGQTIAPVDLRSLDPAAVPVDFVRFAPKTASLIDRAIHLRQEAASLSHPEDARRYAESRIEEVVA